MTHLNKGHEGANLRLGKEASGFFSYAGRETRRAGRGKENESNNCASHGSSHRGVGLRKNLVIEPRYPPPVGAQNPPQFSGTFAFGNGPIVGAITATNGNLTGTLTFAGACPAQITGTYQETGQTAVGQLTATPSASATCPLATTVFNFFAAVSSSKAYFSFSVVGTNNQFSEEGFK